MSNKAKGSKAERELYDLFVANGFRAVRVAGSGMMENTSADLIAGKFGVGKYSIEAKSSKAPVKYITKEQIEQFVIFSEIFGLEPVVALRFNREGWLFVKPEQLRDSGKNWAITLEEAKTIGKRFSQFFNLINNSVNSNNS
ncbi:Holliday junction resolvase [Candidatus Pacearchaeota archaeon]|nr:Holliday junction resolvase [Candidatus Pacearchaeota archaeon]